MINDNEVGEEKYKSEQIDANQDGKTVGQFSSEKMEHQNLLEDIDSLASACWV